MIGRCFLVLCVAVFQLAPVGTAAQGKFSPEIQVGDSVVTRHQIDQRTLFLTLLGAAGDVRELAREQLINEAVQMSAVRDAELEISPEQVEAGMAEFAGRANLETEQLLALLGQAGIQTETFRDFMTAGVAWRELVRTRFNDEARGSIPRITLPRTLARTGTEGGVRVLVSEVLLPTASPETALASRARAAEIATLTNESDFAAAARQFSIAPSAARGGELDWVALEVLPDDVRGIIGALSPGQVSRPVELENSVGVFLMRDVERVASGVQQDMFVEYALFITGGGQAEAQRVAAEVDTCDDLYGAAIGLPEERLVRETKPRSEIAGDILRELSTLDEFEVSTALVRGGGATVLMLCQRRPGEENTVDLNIVGNRLVNTRLGTTAAHYLAELRSETVVIDLTN
ncbi:MAG: peptidylprolyl isomerase [Silicimonas sp.]|nr:peptidylprolyl isomerase [Silicimonas sp.]